jgi:hypothetical protein
VERDIFEVWLTGWFLGLESEDWRSGELLRFWKLRRVMTDDIYAGLEGDCGEMNCGDSNGLVGKCSLHAMRHSNKPRQVMHRWSCAVLRKQGGSWVDYGIIPGVEGRYRHSMRTIECSENSIRLTLYITHYLLQPFRALPITRSKSSS